MNFKFLYLPLFLFVIFSTSNKLYSETITINSQTKNLNISKNCTFYEDITGNLKIKDIVKKDIQNSFIKNNEKIFKRGYTKSRYWLKFKIKNKSKNNTGFFIKIDVFYISEANLYIKKEKRGFYVSKDGLRSSSKNKNITARTPVFWVTIPYNQEKTLYLSLKSISRIITPISIHTPLDYLKTTRYYNMLNSAYFGILFIITLINLILYFTVGDKAYLFLGVWVGLFLLAEIFLTGYSNLFFENAGTFIKEKGGYLLGSFSTLALIAFIKVFLNTNKLSSKLDKFLSIDFLFRILLIIFAIMPLFPFKYSIFLHLADVFIRLILIYVICVIGIFKRKIEAVYYLVAFSIFSFGILFFMLSIDGYLPGNFFTENAKKIGSVIANVVLTFGIADKVRNIRHTAARAHSLEKLNKKLEREISEREKVEEELRISYEEINRSRFALQKAFSELEKFNKMKDEFLAVASHDLRSPFTAILGFTDLLKKDDNLTEKQRHFIEIINKNAGLQLSYINHLLDIIKMESGKMELQLNKHKISEVVETSTNLLGILANQKGINFIHSLTGNGCRENIPMDFPKIVQVMNNYISNAIKFTPQNGEIKITCMQENGFIKVSVLDTGIGINEDIVKTVFNHYKQVSDIGTNGEKGSGLGLAICKNIVNLHGGEVGASKREKNGSIFWFTLPLKK